MLTPTFNCLSKKSLAGRELQTFTRPTDSVPIVIGLPICAQMSRLLLGCFHLLLLWGTCARKSGRLKTCRKEALRCRTITNKVFVASRLSTIELIRCRLLIKTHCAQGCDPHGLRLAQRLLSKSIHAVETNDHDANVDRLSLHSRI